MARSTLACQGAGCILALGACATVDATQEYERAAKEIQSATGVSAVYRPGEDEQAGARVRALLEAGLELREAVEVALLNNPGLQAVFGNVGLAKADRVQAGLLTNPSLSLALRFPTSGGPTEFEAGLFGNLLDLWQRSARIGSAERALERSILEVAHHAVVLAAAVRAAYIEALAAERQQRIAEENRATALRLLELVEARVAAQAATAVDANLAHLEVSVTDVRLRDARLAVTGTSRTLATLLGFDRWPPGITLSSPLPEERLSLPALERLLELAAEHRLDVRAAREAVREAEAEVQRQQGLFVRELDVGAVAEKRDDWSVGPGVQIQLPLFDQNQAQVAKASALHAQRERILSATRLAAVQDVASAFEHVQANWEIARLYAEQILKRSQATLDLASEAYRLGKTTIVPVVEAQRSLLDARREHVERLRQAASAVSELERATGTPRERLFDPEPGAGRR